MRFFARFDATPEQVAALGPMFERAEEIDDVGHGAQFVVVAHVNLERDTRDGSRQATIRAAWVEGQAMRRVKSAVEDAMKESRDV